MAPRPPVAPASATLTMFQTVSRDFESGVFGLARRRQLPIYISDGTRAQIAGLLLWNPLMLSATSIAPTAYTYPVHYLGSWNAIC